MKGFFVLICSTLAFVLNTCMFSVGNSFTEPIPSPPLPSCTWGPTELFFIEVELSMPDCVNLGWTHDSVFYDISSPFLHAYYGAGIDRYGEFIWTSTNSDCNEQTRTRTTILNTAANNMSSLSNNIPIDSALVMIGSSFYNTIGHACIKIDNILNFDTGQIISLVWESPEYSGNAFFRNLEFVATAQMAVVSDLGRVYIHNEFQ